MSIQLIALLANIGLAVLKFIVGTMAGSRALIADAFNSAGDIVATFVAWVAFHYGRKPPDAKHPYGHHNAETLAGLLIGGMLSATGAFICIDGILALLETKRAGPPEVAAIWAAALTAVVKEVLYRVSMRAGKKTNSPTLLASARDHRADVVSSLVALLGIFIARLGYPQVDALAAALIGVYIFYLGIDPVQKNMATLMHAAPPELADQAAKVAREVEGIQSIRQVRAQPMGGRHRMDMVVWVDGTLTVDQAHAIAHEAEMRILSEVENILEVHIHVEPAEGEGEAQASPPR